MDTNPAVQPHEKFKMVASSGGGATMFSSPDGFKFSPMTPKPSLTGSDTQDVVFFDERYNQCLLRECSSWVRIHSLHTHLTDLSGSRYVYYGRTHERGGPPCPAGTQQAGRSIGRMLLGTNVSSWPVASADKVPTIFNVDADDVCPSTLSVAFSHLSLQPNRYRVLGSIVRLRAWMFTATLRPRTRGYISCSR